MQIKKSRLAQIVREEILHACKTLKEAPTLRDAHEDKSEKEVAGGKGEKKAVKPQSGPDTARPADKQAQKGKQPGEDKRPASSKPAAGSAPEEVEPDEAPSADGGEEETEAGADDKGEPKKTKVGVELPGKIVQSVTMEPKSKILPGATEVVITFNDTPDPFRILIPKSGVPKFFWRGLHNTL